MVSRSANDGYDCMHDTMSRFIAGITRTAAGVLALAALAGSAQAATVTIGTLLDTDSNSSTGCTIATANGAIGGIDLVATTVVTTSASGATVSRLEKQTCVAGTLGPATTYDAGGWNVGLGNGTGGKAAVESSIPLSFLPPGATMRATVVAANGAGGVDATSSFPVALAPGAPGVPAIPPVEVPLSPWLAPLLGIALAATTAWWRRRHPEQVRLFVVLAVLSVCGIAWAASVIRDGNIGDWSGVAPAVIDAAGDAPPDADVVAVFFQQDAVNLYVRVDADIRVAAGGNQPPVVDAGANQTVTLPASAALAGSATDDGLPNPPGMLTYAWTKQSGPGTVGFANAASPSTSASFGSAGTYVLRLTASDGALSSSADVTISVNPIGTANQPPVVNAGANQTITLPAGAPLVGTATDDGLPNPPGALATTWSVASGPAAAVSFADASSPQTTATFSATGTYTLRLTANDGSLTSSSTMQVAVVDGAPQIAAVADRTIDLGSRLQLTVPAIEGNATDALTYSLVAAPAGATLAPAPLIDWTPTASQLGTHTFTVQVADSHGHSATTSFHVTVTHTNTPPQLAPQPSQSLAIGNPFNRRLTAVDPDPGEVLTFALVSGPPGMTLSGADLNWSTSARTPGDYTVTVKVTDAAGASDQKTFTLTLQATASAVAVADHYEVRVNQTLNVPAAGVLANDFNPSGRSLGAVKLSNPTLGTLSAFNTDGSFTFQAPATVPSAPMSLEQRWKNDAAGQTINGFPVIGDVNGDGYPDYVLSSQFIGHRAVDLRTGATLWNMDATGYGDCRFDFATTNAPLLADVDDDGKLEYVGNLGQCERDSRINAPGYAPSDRIFALDGTNGRIKWFSERVSRPLDDVLGPGNPPSTEERFKHVYDGAAFASMSVSRLGPNEPPTILFRKTITHGEAAYQHTSGQARNAGCRGLTGVAADDGTACRVTILMSGADGTVQQMLRAPNPTDRSQASWDPWRELAPFTVDLDGDGEVEIVSGSDVWKKVAGTWTLLWQTKFEPIQVLAADLDGDGKPEIVHFHAFQKTGANGDPEYQDFNGLIIYDGASGQELRRIRLPYYWTAWLTIADVDGDGAPNFVINSQGLVMALTVDGRILWTYDIPPGEIAMDAGARSGAANVQVYDLDGDGVPEVVTNSHSQLVILDGRTGRVKTAFASAGRQGGYYTFHDVQVVDADNDGHADILAVNVSDTDRIDYVLYRGASHDWLPGPKAFHQANYQIGDVSDTGRVLFNAAVPTSFRNPKQLGTIRDPRETLGTRFAYAVNDGTSQSAPADVFIEIKPANLPPVITSTPPTGLLQRFNPNPPGGLFTNYYQVTAFDPDPGDTLTYSLHSAPSYVTMDPAGRIRFEPTCGSYGYPCPWGWTYLSVRVTDSQGAFAEQSFMVNLTTSGATVPDVVGQMLVDANATVRAAGLTPRVQNEVYDAQPAGRVLVQSPIAGAANIGNGEAVNLTVSKGPQPVLMPFVVGQQIAGANTLLGNLGLSANLSSTFSTSIPAGEIISQSPAPGTLVQPATAAPVELTVSAGGPLAAPIARIDLVPGAVTRLAGDSIPYRALATLTDGTGADVTFSATWSSSTPAAAGVNASGVARAIAAGAATISATVAGTTGSALLTVAALAAGDRGAPTATITSPAEGADVTGPVSIVGTASDPNFLRYELAIAPANESSFTVIAEGTTAVTGGTLGTFDPTVLANDLYTIRLRVFDRGQNETTTTTTVQARGRQKPGLFTLAYTDLTLASPGVPVSVSRIYDSRVKAQGDFGIGWKLGIQTLTLRSNRILGTGWDRTVSGPTVTLAPVAEHRMSLTLSDGTVEQFDLQLAPTSNLGSLDFTHVAGFVPRPGTLGKLEYLGNPDLLIVDDAAGTVLVDDSTLDVFDPRRFRYTTSDGLVIEIDRVDGVKRVVDRNGNTVSYGPDGIVHSSGQSVLFHRDAKGRVVEIVDPNGNARTYAYDANGDLAQATDATGARSRYRYDRNHNLIEIVDPSGQGGLRSEYDDAGHLTAVIDAAGRRVEIGYAPASSQETVRDRRGNVTRLDYDADGNVTRSEALVTVDGVLTSAATTTTYDARGNETSTVDADGRRVAATFDRTSPLSRVVDPGGLALTTTFEYDVFGNPTRVTDAAGKHYDFDYDAGGNLVAADLPLGGASSATADARGLVTGRIDALGNVTTFDYDGAGRLIRERVNEGASTLLRRTEFSYDANGNLKTQTLYRTIDGTPTPLVTEFTYDAANRLIAVRDPAGNASRTEYDAAGRVIAQIDPLGRRTVLAYNVLGLLERTTFADGTFETLGYDGNGNLTSRTARGGRTTSYLYDELDRPIATIAPDGATRRSVYSAAGQTTATIDERGNRTDFAYDAAGRLVRTTQPAVVDAATGTSTRPETRRALNGAGAVTAITDPNGRTTTIALDASGRPVTTTLPDGSTIGQRFDALGRRTRVINEEGEATTLDYDALGRVVASHGLAGDATYQYDEAGNLVAQTDALGHTTRFRYDAVNRLVERRYPNGDTQRYAYDAAGNLVAATDGLGRTTTFDYDAMNRVVRKTPPGSAAVLYAYHPDGQIATITDVHGVTAYAYDARGRLANVTRPTGDVVHYTRGADDLLATLASPAATVTYDYDALGRLATVHAPEGNAAYGYDPAGNLLRLVAANGVRTDQAFDARNRPTAITHRAPSGATIAAFGTTWSPAGRRTGTTDADGSIERYSYDAKGRLATQTRTGSAALTMAYVYDGVGNLTQLTRNGQATTFTLDANDRVVADGSNTYAYDANGNLVSRSGPAGTTTYGYDPQDRLVSVLAPDHSAQYEYDARGDRVRATVDGQATRFVVDRDNPTLLAQVLEERDSAGTLNARYTYGATQLAMQRAGAASFGLRDAHGNVRALANAAGSISDTYGYEAYGNPNGVSGPTPNPYRYAGERFDAETGLYHLRARQYDPALRRFLSRDPLAGSIESPRTFHRYLYANADPVNFSDPTGRESLASLTIAQSISNTIDAAETVSEVNAACNAFTTLGGVGYVVLATELAYGALSAVGVPFGSLKTSYSIVAFNPAPLKRDDIKSIDLRYEPSPAVKLSISYKDNTSKGLSIEPTGVYTSFTKSKKLKEFYKCGTIPVGSVSLKQTTKNWLGINLPSIPALSLEVELLKVIRNEWKFFDGFSVDLRSPTGFE